MNPLVDLQFAGKFLPRTPAIIQNEEILFSQFADALTNRVSFLKTLGIKERDKCAILSPNNQDFILNVLALWKLSAIPVLINTRITTNEIREQLNFTGCKFLFADRSYVDKPDIENINIISDFTYVISFVETHSLSPGLDTTAVILFTSGSSGKPKGVELTFRNLIASAEGANSFLNSNHNDRWLASLPFFHIGGFSIITRALLYGNPIIMPESLSTDDLCKAIRYKKPTLTSFVSTQLQNLIDSNCSPNPELRNVLLGGGFIDTELILNAQQKGWNTSKVYGSSETSSMVTALDSSKKKKLDSVGKPLLNNSIIIIDENGKILPADSPGEICIKGDSVIKGYFNNPEETGIKFIDEYYHSGDIGYFDKEGYLFIEARRTDLIISGGENIAPSEVEKVIIQHPSVLEAAVFPIEDKTWGHIPVAAVVLKETTSLTYDELKDFLKGTISGYKIPKKLLVVSELPKSALGKIERQKLKDLLK